MPYLKYNDDPLAQRVSKAFADLCSSLPTKKSLRLIDKCFSIFNGGTKETSFCLDSFNYPADGSQSIDFEVCAGETLVLYNNGLDEVTIFNPMDMPQDHPFGEGTEFIESDPQLTNDYYVITNDRNYARGCLLLIHYPNVDKNGDDVLPADYECKITFTNRLNETFTIPAHEFFAHFCNPETRSANSLINKIEVTNPNPNFSIKVSGLVIYLKSNTDPSDCAC